MRLQMSFREGVILAIVSAIVSAIPVAIVQVALEAFVGVDLWLGIAVGIGIFLLTWAFLWAWYADKRDLSSREAAALVATMNDAAAVASSRSLPVGDASAGLTVGDLLKDPRLQVTQLWSSGGTTVEVAGALSSQIAGVVGAGSESVLVLGHVGSGKSFSMQSAADILYRRIEEGSATTPIPLVINLGLVDASNGIDRMTDLLSDDMLDRWELPRWRARLLDEHGRFTWMLDGWDEFASDAPSDAQVVLTATSRNGALSSRTDYWSRAGATESVPAFTRTFELKGIQPGDSLGPFVDAYCCRTGADKNPILRRLEADGMDELLTRPLLLWMVVDTATSEDPSEGPWTQSRVYSLYTRKWLKRETRRNRSTFNLDAKDMLARVTARALFARGSVVNFIPTDTSDLRVSMETLSREIDETGGSMLGGLKEQYGIDVVLREAVEHTLLKRFETAPNADGLQLEYWFAHKSFLEYYIAHDLVSTLADPEPDPVVMSRYLSRPLPDPVIYFVREMLTEILGETVPQAAISSSLSFCIERNPGPDSESEAIRQHAANLLALVGDDRGLEVVRACAQQDPSAFVRRGAVVGLAMHQRDRVVLGEYVRRLESDSDAVAVQIGYSRIYHGDQVYQQSWSDDGGPDVTETVLAQIDRLVSQTRRERNRMIWPLTLFSLRALTEDGRALSVYENHDSALRQLVVVLPELETDEWTDVAEQALELRAALRASGVGGI